MSGRKIYVADGRNRYGDWLGNRFVGSMRKADVVVLTGGEDISPSIYNKSPHVMTRDVNVQRDKYDIEQYRKARKLGIPIVGICRAAQLIGALNGLSLVQHMNHPIIHPIKTNDGGELFTTSLHHQRVYTKGANEDIVKVLAWAEGISPYSFGEDEYDLLPEEREAEVIWYPQARSIGIQGHVEMCLPYREDWHEAFVEYCRGVVEKYLEV